jgi:hypothetical protein
MIFSVFTAIALATTSVTAAEPTHAEACEMASKSHADSERIAVYAEELVADTLLHFSRVGTDQSKENLDNAIKLYGELQHRLGKAAMLKFLACENL